MFTENVSAQSECRDDHMDACSSDNGAERTLQATGGSLRMPAFETRTSRWLSRLEIVAASSAIESFLLTSQANLENVCQQLSRDMRNVSACPIAEPPVGRPISLSSDTFSSIGSLGKATTYTFAPFVTSPWQIVVSIRISPFR